jgi:hypothetical protein
VEFSGSMPSMPSWRQKIAEHVPHVKSGKTPRRKPVGDHHFIKRLESLIHAAGGRTELEQAAALKRDSLRTYLRGSEPTRPVLAKLASATGVSVDWLATGRGNDEPIRLSPRSQRFDQDCMRQVIEAVEESGIQKGAAEKAELVLALYEMYCSTKKAPDRKVILRLIKTGSSN